MFLYTQLRKSTFCRIIYFPRNNDESPVEISKFSFTININTTKDYPKRT